MTSKLGGYVTAIAAKKKQPATSRKCSSNWMAKNREQSDWKPNQTENKRRNKMNERSKTMKVCGTRSNNNSLQWLIFKITFTIYFPLNVFETTVLFIICFGNGDFCPVVVVSPCFTPFDFGLACAVTPALSFTLAHTHSVALQSTYK